MNTEIPKLLLLLYSVASGAFLGCLTVYHPHHIHDLTCPKALIYMHLMMFIQLGVKQNEKQNLDLNGRCH